MAGGPIREKSTERLALDNKNKIQYNSDDHTSLT